MNGALKANPRIVAKQPRFGVGGPANAGMETKIPGHLAVIGQHRFQMGRVRHLETLVGIDVQDPAARRLVDRKVAGCGEVVAPRKMIEFDWKLPRLFKRVVARPGIDQDDLVYFADK